MPHLKLGIKHGRKRNGSPHKRRRIISLTLTTTVFLLLPCQGGALRDAYDGSGIWICTKRLETGRFTWPVSEIGQVNLRGEEFSALIHGLEIHSKRIGIGVENIFGSLWKLTII